MKTRDNEENGLANAPARLLPANDDTTVFDLWGHPTGSLRDERRHVGNTAASVSLIGGSPVMSLDNQPTLWFENWIRARSVRARA